MFKTIREFMFSLITVLSSVAIACQTMVMTFLTPEMLMVKFTWNRIFEYWFFGFTNSAQGLQINGAMIPLLIIVLCIMGLGFERQRTV